MRRAVLSNQLRSACRVSEIEPAGETPPAALPAYRRTTAFGNQGPAVTAEAARAGAARSLFLPSVRDRL